MLRTDTCKIFHLHHIDLVMSSLKCFRDNFNIFLLKYTTFQIYFFLKNYVLFQFFEMSNCHEFYLIIKELNFVFSKLLNFIHKSIWIWTIEMGSSSFYQLPFPFLCLTQFVLSVLIQSPIWYYEWMIPWLLHFCIWKEEGTNILKTLRWTKI